MQDADTGIACGRTFWELLTARVALTPDRLMFTDEHDRRVTFAEVADWSERVAGGLADLGIDAQSIVSWQLPTRIETVVLSLAIARLGAVQNPIIALYREREVGSLLRTTGAHWFVVPGTWRGFDHTAMAQRLQAKAAERGRPPLSILVADPGLPEGDPSTLPPIPTDGDTVRWLYSTSGTTSEPKAVRHTDGTLIAGGIGLTDRVRPTPRDIGSIPYPFAHIGGPDYLVMMLRTGLPAVLMETFVPAQAFELLRRHGVTLTGGSTAHYLALLAGEAEHPGTPPVPTLRMVNGGGAPKPPELYWRAKERLGIPLVHGFGMTESPMICNGSVDDTDEQLANTDGAPVDGCEVRIEDDAGAAVPPGVDGHILVRGAMVAKGYMDPVQTAESFRPDGYFRTGDRGHLRDDGHIVITGRAKELIIRKGENISPGEIENVLSTHSAVAAVAVIGLPDPARGERVCAVVETAAGAPPLTFEQMAEHCRDAGLMVQKIPEQLELIDELPRNPTMKVLKRVLVTTYARDDNEE